MYISIYIYICFRFKWKRKWKFVVSTRLSLCLQRNKWKLFVCNGLHGLNGLAHLLYDYIIPSLQQQNHPGLNYHISKPLIEAT